MKFLNSDELKIAETTLYAHLPKSIKVRRPIGCMFILCHGNPRMLLLSHLIFFQVYGFVFAMNRRKPHTLEVLVDKWPAFTTFIVRPDPNVRLRCL